MAKSGRLALGLDFGTESVRALLVDVESGAVAGRGEQPYAHGVMAERLLPDGPPLPADFALQQPRDYLDALERATAAALAAAGSDGAAVAGIGVDFTACTMLPVDAALAPLCWRDEFRREPHAFVKLWKHHGAIAEAEAINRTARELGEPWLARYGGTTSSEWLLAKAFETLHRAPRVFEAAARFVEASDWVVADLAGLGGRFVRGACAAGYKGLWNRRDGPPGEKFLARLDPRLARFFVEKTPGDVVAAGVAAGRLTRAWAARLRVNEGTPVSAAIIDAHAAVPGAGVTKPGSMVAILGTSACHMLLSEREQFVPGIQGVVEDGIVPGLFGYEAGQAAFGDTFEWFVERLLGAPHEARGRLHAELSARAAALPAGKSGLLVLDWWNGNRSILVDPRLSGLVVGLTGSTRPEELYRALIEGAAFSTRKIVENFVANGVAVDEVVACGGIAEKSELVLQLLADVTGRPIVRVNAPEVCALGAAICGAVAAEPIASGESIRSNMARAIGRMAARDRRTIQPRPGEAKLYGALYRRWERLHDHFGRLGDPKEGGDDVMRFLRELRGV
jgi:L-ribulokinase